MIFLPHIISLSPLLRLLSTCEKKKGIPVRPVRSYWLIDPGGVLMPGGCGPPCRGIWGIPWGREAGQIHTVCVLLCVLLCVCVPGGWQHALLTDPVGCLPLALFPLNSPIHSSLLSLSLYSSSPLFLFRERAFCNAKLLHVIWWRKETKENGIMKNTIHLVWTYAAAGNEIKQTHVRHLFFLFGHCQELCTRKKKQTNTGSVGVTSASGLMMKSAAGSPSSSSSF